MCQPPARFADDQRTAGKLNMGTHTYVVPYLGLKGKYVNGYPKLRIRAMWPLKKRILNGRNLKFLGGSGEATGLGNRIPADGSGFRAEATASNS